jgi:peroxiredoxin
MEEERVRTAVILIWLLFPLHAAGVPIGSPAPAFVLIDTAGNRVNSAGYKGKILLISFFSPWCIPCREELAALQGLYAAYGKDGLEVVAISVERSQRAVSGFLKKTQLTFPVLMDENRRVSEAYQCSHLPTTVIISRDGIVRNIRKGYDKDMLHEYEQIIIEVVKQK